MKKVLLLMVCALMGFALNAQVSDDFSDYTVGGKIAQQAQAMGRDYWTTWGDEPGSSDDGVVAEIDGNKCGNLSWGNDQVLRLGQKNSGAWDFSMKMRIPTGTCGYFNMIGEFHPENPSITVWALQVYLGCKGEGDNALTPGVGTVHITGSNSAGFTFAHDTWIDIHIFIDLDLDEAYLYIDGNRIFAWLYSDGTFGEGCPKVIDVLNIYPPRAGSNFYVDDIVFEEGTPLLPAILDVDPKEVEVELPVNSTKNAPFMIISEQEGSRKANWSAYVDYSPLGTGAGDDFELTLCDIYSAGPPNGIGSTSGSFDREIGMKLRPIDYKEKLGGVLKQIGYYVDFGNLPAGDLILRVYGQGLAENKTGELLAEQAFTASNFQDGWNWVDIDPVQLTGGEYWVTVQMHQLIGTYPMSADAGPAVYGGDWIRTGEGGSWNAWGKLSEASTTISTNWAIQVKGDGEVETAWGSLDIAYGVTFAASESEIKAIANSNGFTDGIYTANIVVLTTVEDYDRFDIPFAMKVGDYASNDTSVDEVTVDGIVADEQQGLPYDYRVTIHTDKYTAEIAVTPHHDKATVKGEIGEQTIKQGVNDFVFTVVAEDGTEEDYSLRVMADIVAITEITNEMSLYPNPVSDYLYIKADVVIEQVTIYDLTGKVVKQVKQPTNSIDLSELASGFYMLKATTPQGEMMQKFIKE